MTPPAAPPLARRQSRVIVAPKHSSLVAAFEAAAADSLPFLTIHTNKGEVHKGFADLLHGAWRWAAVLKQRGAVRGDRIPILMQTGHGFVEALLGTMIAGAVPVPLATPMTFGSVDKYLKNLAAIVEDCGATLLITYPRIRDGAKLDPDLSARLRDVITEADLEGVAPTPMLPPSLDGSDTAFIQYTSGTTGRPKGAVISHRALVSNAFSVFNGLGLSSTSVGVSWLPLFHDMGLIGVLLTAICNPYPLHLLAPEAFVMSPKKWLDLIGKAGGTLTAAPNFAYELCVARGGDLDVATNLGSLTIALNGAEPVHATTVARFQDKYAAKGFRPDAMMPVYGMAEATLAVTFPDLASKFETMTIDRDALEGAGRIVLSDAMTAHTAVSCGYPVPGMSVEIVGDDGAVLPERTVGHILVGGPSLMDGYFRNDAASAEALSGGRLKSGDLGFMDQGRLFITGRAKEIIIKGGRNLYPYDVERVVGEVEGLRQGAVAAFARSNSDSGTDDLIVVAETTIANPEKREAIVKTIRGELLAVLGTKADEIHLWGPGQVPRTTSGKIRRKECAKVLLTKKGAT